MKVKALAIGATLVCAGFASADHVSLSVEDGGLFDTSSTLFGPNVGMVQIWRVYANVAPDEAVIALGSTTLDPAMTINNVTAGGEMGSGFWNHAPTPGFGPAAASDFAYTADQGGAEADTYLTIGAAAGWAMIGDFGIAQGTPGFAPNMNGPSITIDDGAYFVTPDNPFGTPDGDGRVLIMQLTVAAGEHVQGSVNLDVVPFAGAPGDDGFGIVGLEFNSIPAPGALALLGLAGLAGRRRRA